MNFPSSYEFPIFFPKSNGFIALFPRGPPTGPPYRESWEVQGGSELARLGWLLVWLGFGWLFLGFGLIWLDFGWIWLDFRWIWLGLGWIWLGLDSA